MFLADKINKRSLIKIFTFILLGLLVFGLANDSALAQRPGPLEDVENVPLPVNTNPEGLYSIGSVLARIVNIAFWGAGGVFVVMILITAIKYSMSQGDPKGLEGAKNTLTYAVFGFLVAIGFFAISSIITTAIGLEGSILTSPAKNIETAISDLGNKLTELGDEGFQGLGENNSESDTRSVQSEFDNDCWEHVQSGNWYCSASSDFSSGNGCRNLQGARVCLANEGSSGSGHGCVYVDGHLFCEN